jgi:hypothetical protein
MGAKLRVEHIGAGYMSIWKSPRMQQAVDVAGERMAEEANSGYAHEGFRYWPRMGRATAGGFVGSTGPTGDYYEQRDKALSKAVHP